MTRKETTAMRCGRMAEWLFGEVPALKTPRSTVVGWLIFFVLGTVGAFLRIPPVTRNLLWAEDGRNFLADALGHPPFGGLFEPYAGYMHAVPRLVSLVIADIVPLERVPEAIAVAACAITASIATLVLALLRPRIPQLLPRLALALAIIALPAGVETNGNIANAHWYLLMGLFVILLTRQTRVIAVVIAATFTGFAVLSDPLSAIFLPFVAMRFVSIKRPRDLAVPITFTVGLVIQLTVVLTTTVSKAATSPTVGQLLNALGFRAYLTALAGQNGATALYLSWGAGALLAATVVIATGVVWTFFATSRLSGLAVSSVLTGTLFYLVSAWVRWYPQFDPRLSPDWTGGNRYSAVPVVLVLIGLAAASAGWRGRPRGWVLSNLGGLALLLVVVTASAPTIGTSARSSQQGWVTALAASRQTCKTLSASHPISIQIAPDNGSWQIRTTCGVLQEYR